MSVAATHDKILFMRTYELVLVLKPSLTEPARKKLVETVKDWLGKVKVTNEADWGSKALKYKIKKELTGHFFDIKFEGDNIPAEFEKRVMLEDMVLRHLLIRTK